MNNAWIDKYFADLAKAICLIKVGYYARALYADSLHRFSTQILNTDTLHKYSSQILYISTLHKYSSQVLFTDTVI